MIIKAEEPNASMGAVTSSEFLDMGRALTLRADRYRAGITLGTKAQWEAWEAMMSAARHLHNAGVWLARHEGADVGAADAEGGA